MVRAGQYSFVCDLFNLMESSHDNVPGILHFDIAINVYLMRIGLGFYISHFDIAINVYLMRIGLGFYISHFDIAINVYLMRIGSQ